jgi:TP901 family phage tail tape measure protein
MAKGGAAAAATSLNMQQGLLNSINQTGKFSATIRNVKSTTDSFTDSLQKNKLSMGEYFRYAGASTKSFGRFFRTEFETINKVARERVKDLQTQYIKMGRDANGAMRAIAVRPLALDMENLATKTQIAAQRQALLNQLLKQGSTNLLNFGKNTQWAGRQLMVGFTVPLVMLGSVAAKTFMDMEKQAVRFKRVYGEMFTTTEQTNKALEEIKSLAAEFTRYGIAVSKTMELAADIAATGKMGAELNAQVAETTRLAILGGVEQAEALQATISLTDAFGVAAEDLAEKIDFLNAVENQTITSIEDLTIAIPKAGPVVQQLGGDVEDLTFFLTAMREGGINASEGANALKSGLAALINPTRQASEMLQGFGINITGIVEANAGDVKGLVLDFATALDGLDPLNRARAIEQLFGKFQFSRLSTLFQNVIKEGNQASRVLKLSNATTEELAVLSEREMKRIEDSPMFKFQKAIEDIKVTLVPLGEAFLKAVTPLLEFGTSILKKFDELDDGAKSFVVGLTAIAGVIGPVFLMGFGLIANGVANVIKMFAFFKASLNKAGTASTELGMQTDYMTQQQLEAAAVAASLDQVHQKLRQTFTSETAAVNALTAAYNRSIAAQGAMAGGAIGRTRPGLKLASGIMSVPGPKGAGDVVPAMLSPGEAVIPAKQSKKYSGIISSLIADNVPGFRIGRNPFASMLGRSKVAVRMRDSDFSSELAASGKNARYKSAFDTQTGADYIRPSGSVNERQKELRSAMERDVFGLDQKTTPTSARPTYGYARTPILSSFINKLFGIKGKNFNAVTRNVGEGSLAKYGNIDLVTKGSVAKRSSAFAGDALVRYHWAAEAQSFKRRAADLKVRLKRTGVQPAPMKGASPEQLGSFDGFGSPFKRYKNEAPPYVETYTPGGFRFSEIDKIIARDPVIAKRLKEELRAAGLGGVRVTGSNFAARLFKQMGVPGYSEGTTSIDFDRNMTTQMAHMSDGRDNLTEKEIKRLAGKEISRLIASGTYDRLGIDPQQDIDHVRNNTSGANSLYAGRLEPVLTVTNQGTANRDALRSGATYLRELKGLPRGLFGSGILATIDAAKASGARIDIPNRDLVRYMRNVRKAYESELKKNHGRMLSESDNNKLYENATKKAISKITNPNIQSKFKDLVAYSSAMLTPASPNTGSVSGNTRRYQPGRNIQKLLRSITSSGGSLGQLLGPNYEREYSSRILDKTKISVPRDVKDRIVSLRGQLSKKDMADVSRSLINASYETDKTARFEGYRNVLNSASSGNFGVIPPTGGVPRPSSVRRTGGTPQDTRLLLTNPGETVLSEKSTNSIKQGGTASVPGIGRMGRFGPMPMRVAGAFDGIPNGQTQSPVYTGKLAPPPGPGSIAVPGIPAGAGLANDFANAAPLTQEVKSGRFKTALNGTFQKFVAVPLAKTINGGVHDLVDSKGNVIQKAGTSTFISRLVGNQKANLDKKAGIAPAADTRYLPNSQLQGVAPVAGAQQTGTQQPVAGGGFSGKVAAGASVAGMGAMMYGMSGGPGAEIAMMASMPLMMAPMLGKLAPVVLGLGALAAGAFALKNAFDSAEKAARESTLATGASTQSIVAFAEFAGNATAGEIMDEKRSNALDQFGVQSGKETFGNLFLQSEAAKPILDGLMGSVKAGASSESMIATTRNQLGTAIATGALSKDQAASIAASLGEAIGDRSFGIRVIGELNELVGIDGSNLLENPIEVRVKLIEESNNKLREMIAGPALRDAQGQQAAGGALAAAGGVAGGVAGGIGGAIAGAKVVSMVGAMANAGKVALAIGRIGAMGGPVGAVAGLVVGAAAGAFMLYDGFQKAGAAAGAVSAQGIIALQQNQEMLDSLDVEYDKRIAVAKAAGDLVKVNELIEEREQGRQKILEASRDTVGMLVEQYQAADFFGVNPMGESLDRTIDSMYKDDPLMQQVMTGARRSIEGSSGTAEQEYTLKLMLASGNVDPGTMSNLMATFGNDQDAIEKIVNISLNLGSADAGRTFALASLFGEDEVTKKDFLARIEAKVPTEARKTLDMFELVQKTGGVLEMEVVLNAYMADPDAGDKLVADLERFKELQAEDTVITQEVIQEVFGQEAMNAVVSDWEYFSGLDKEQQLTYMTLVQTAFETIEHDPDAYNTWAAVQEAAGKDSSEEAYAAFTGYQGTELFTRNRELQEDMQEDTGGGSGGPAASSLDEILKKLRDVRKNQIGVMKGFEDSAAAINKLFGDGKGINLFSGIENDMRRLGAEENLIDLIVGMDPEEFEKQKNTLFNFDTQTGEIIGFKDQLQNVGRALSAIALGQYVTEQQKSAKESRNQVLAFNQLRAAGYSVADAYETVQDAAVASAIATGNVTRDQMDTMLQELRAAQAAMKEAARLTPEGLQEVFEDGFNKAMESFDAKERKLTFEFELKIKDDQEAITAAENEIAKIRYEIDDYEASLRGVEQQEEAINKTYDTKLEALEKVRVANQKVLDQEKGRLSVAEAITRGDLAATARAVQDLRQSSASGYFSSQTDALNSGRQSALDAIRNESGLSRIEVEEKIKKLTDEIFDIEEKTLEPANERIRLAQVELDARLKEETVLGRTRDQWNEIKINIDLARINSVGYKEAMDEALAVVDDVLDAWNGIQSKTVVLTTIQRTIQEGDPTPYVPTGPSGDPDPDPDPVDTKPTITLPSPNAEGKRLRSAMNADPLIMAAALKAAGADNGSADQRDRRLATYLSKVTKDQVDVILSKGVPSYENQQGMFAPGQSASDVLGMFGPSASDVFNPYGAGYAVGGLISGPGTGTSDSIPAMLSNGEYVIKAATVKQFGTKMFDNLNAGSLPILAGANSMSTPRFASVGSTASVNQASVLSRQAAASSSNSVYNYNLSVNVASQSDPNTIAQTVMAQLQRVDSQRVRNGRF